MSAPSPYYSQLGQDIFLDKEVFKGKRNGFYIEIGAADGVHFSNTLFLNREREWKGILVEPHPEFFQACKKNRPVDACYELCLYDKEVKEIDFRVNTGETDMLSGIIDAYQKEHAARIEREQIRNVIDTTRIIKRSTMRLADLLARDFPDQKQIDLITVDCEGAELEILNGFDFDAVQVDIWVIEINYDKDEKTKQIEELMTKKGYKEFKRMIQDRFYCKG